MKIFSFKRFCFTFFFVLNFISRVSYSQISYEEVLIISLSNDYLFINDIYYSSDVTPNYNLLGSTLSKLQARYDRGFDAVKFEWEKLRDLNMINYYTNSKVNDYRKQVSAWLELNGSKIDYGYGDNASRVVNYITGVYKIPGVKDELKLLQSINREIKRLKSQNPDGFHNSTRYKEIMNVISELRNCNISDFGDIAYKYGLF